MADDAERRDGDDGEQRQQQPPPIVVLLHTLPPGPSGVRAEEAAFRQYNSCVDFTFEESLGNSNARKLKRLNAIFERAADRRSGGIREDRLLRILPSGSAPKYGIDPAAVKRRVHLRREQQEAERASRKGRKKQRKDRSGGSGSNHGSGIDGGEGDPSGGGGTIAELRIISRGTFLAMFANETTTVINTMGQNEKADRERRLLKAKSGSLSSDGASSKQQRQKQQQPGGGKPQVQQQHVVRIAEPQTAQQQQQQQQINQQQPNMQVLQELSNTSTAKPKLVRSASAGDAAATNRNYTIDSGSGGGGRGGGKSRKSSSRRKKSSRRRDGSNSDRRARGSDGGGGDEGRSSSRKSSSSSSRRSTRNRSARGDQSLSGGSVSSGGSMSSLSSSGVGGVQQQQRQSSRGGAGSSMPGHRRNDSSNSLTEIFTPLQLRRSLSQDQMAYRRQEAGALAGGGDGLSPDSVSVSPSDSDTASVTFPVGGMPPDLGADAASVPLGGHGADMAGGWCSVVSDSTSASEGQRQRSGTETKKKKSFPPGIDLEPGLKETKSFDSYSASSADLVKRDRSKEERRALRRERRRKKEEARRVEVARELRLVEDKRRALEEEHARMVRDQQQHAVGRGVYSGAISEDEEFECVLFSTVANALKNLLPSLGRGNKASVGVAPVNAKAAAARPSGSGGARMNMLQLRNNNYQHRRNLTWNHYNRPVTNVRHQRNHSMDDGQLALPANVAPGHSHSFALASVPLDFTSLAVPDMRQSLPTNLVLQQTDYILRNASFSSYSSHSSVGSDTLAGERVIVPNPR